MEDSRRFRLLIAFTMTSILLILSAKLAMADSNCTLGSGYWKDVPDQWPVTSLTLGEVAYNRAQLVAVLEHSRPSNGIVALAHHLIAAKLNVANGADDAAVRALVVEADALIGSQVVPPIGTGSLGVARAKTLGAALAEYNLGVTGPGPCLALNPTDFATWGDVKALYR